MVFSDPIFVFLFLPVCLALYWSFAWKIRNAFLCAVGSVFYLWGGGYFILLLWASVFSNFYLAKLLRGMPLSKVRSRKWALSLAVVLNLIPLIVWKYAGFMAAQISSLAQTFLPNWSIHVDLALPIAISFFTFQCISYLVDVYRGSCRPAERLVDFAAYIFLFPHLIAGPIVRYAQIEQELLSASNTRFDDYFYGASRFFWGLGKKIIVADQVAVIVDRVYQLPAARLSSAAAWLGVVAYAIQIYFDFSGYSDMAIGLARMFGFHFPENFNRPYSAHTITDFWRRWHISLSSWFRDYVYIPLGGNRTSSSRLYINLSIVFLLTGVWHGANWTFIVWGGIHGFWLIVERFSNFSKGYGYSWLGRFITFVVVCLAWAVFRADTIGHARLIVSRMLWPVSWQVPLTVTEVLTWQRLIWFGIGLGGMFLLKPVAFGGVISTGQSKFSCCLRLASLTGLAFIACVYCLSSSFSPFLYFKF